MAALHALDVPTMGWPTGISLGQPAADRPDATLTCLYFTTSWNPKSPLIPVPELERLSFKMVIFPVSALLTVCNAVGNLMQELMRRGTNAHLTGDMVSLVDCFETVGLSQMLATDAHYSPTHRPSS